MSVSALLNGIDNCPTKEYVEMCRTRLCIDLKILHDRFSDINNIDIADHLKSDISEKIKCDCKVIENDNCEKCEYRKKIESQVQGANDSFVGYCKISIPPYLLFWSTYHSIVSKMFSVDNNFSHNVDNIHVILKGSCDELITQCIIFCNITNIYDKIIHEYSESDNEFRNLLMFISISDFMNRYSHIVVDIAVYQQSSSRFNNIVSNFKRWAKLESDFKAVNDNYIGVKLLRGLENVLSRKSECLSRDEMSALLRAIVTDYINVLNKNIKAGKVGFIIACRLKMPSMVSVFKDSVSSAYIESVLDEEALKNSKTYKIDRLTADKIIKLLKNNL
jgi:hypothetical protein